jgi:hypothetical protein
VWLFSFLSPSCCLNIHHKDKLYCVAYFFPVWYVLPRKIWQPSVTTFHPSLPTIRVARWYVFRPEIPIWENFGVSCNRRGWCILRTLDIFYGHWYCLWAFGIVCGNLVYFFRFGMLYQEKSGSPADEDTSSFSELSSAECPPVFA